MMNLLKECCGIVWIVSLLSILEATLCEAMAIRQCQMVSIENIKRERNVGKIIMSAFQIIASHNYAGKSWYMFDRKYREAT